MPFCKNCGNVIEPDAEFCRRCGQRVSDGSVGGEIGREIGDSIRNSIIIESIPEIKLIDAIFGGCVVVLIGAVLYLAASGVVPWIGWGNFWAFFLLGLGVLLILKALAVFVIRPARHKALGDLNGGIVLAIIGGVLVVAVTTGDYGTALPWLLIIGGVVIVVVAILTYAAKILIK